MEPELTLLSVFILSLIILKITRKKYEFQLAARIGMAAMLLVTAIAHVVFVKGMRLMIPDIFIFKAGWVYATGIAELLAAIGLLIPRYKVFTGWCLILFFSLLLPVNIYAARKHVNLETATLDGDGLNYLWYRIPLQLLFIMWVYLSTIKPGKINVRQPNRES